jgi:outer membrane protein assembly factor BamE (lipoprotein component of BamABCDE complex)
MDTGPRAVKRPAPQKRMKPRILTRFRFAIIASALALGAGACAPEIHYRGNTPEADRLDLIKPGAQTREQVVRLLGSPTMVATFDKDTILYLGQKTRTVTFREPEVLERTIVAIGFGKDGRVASVEKYSLADGKAVQLVSRTTPTPGRQFSIMQQLIGNFGRFEDSKEPSL